MTPRRRSKTPNATLLYGGDVAKWQKFNNSLYLRLLMRLSNRDDVLGVSEKINEIFSSPALSDLHLERRQRHDVLRRRGALSSTTSVRGWRPSSRPPRDGARPSRSST